jgi:crossover junction endodeoxyribonuclease RuvC
VLGIDPGTRVAGFGVLDLEDGKQPVLVAHGAIRLPPSPLAARLETLFRELRRIIAQHAPRVLAIERVFHGKSFESVLKVGEARGVAVLAAQMAGLVIREYTPAMIKKAATGNGNADKAQVQSMMGRILAMDDAPEPVDASDALAAAFCHGQRSWRERLSAGSGEDSRVAALLRAASRSRRVRFARGGVTAARTGRRAGGRGFDLAALLKSGKARVLDGARKTRRRATASK